MRSKPQSRPWDEAVTGLEYELAREQASALGRVGRKLEAALAALAAFDAQDGVAGAPETRAARRAVLLSAAGTALWHLVVQREACGLRDTRQLLRDYAVPAEVVARMGIMR